MSTRALRLGLAVPPHANAEPHKRLMKGLKKMSGEDFVQSLIQAGIYTPERDLAAHYRKGAAKVPPRKPGTSG
jgi:hypothetical protein